MTPRGSAPTKSPCPSPQELLAWREALSHSLPGGVLDSHINSCKLCQQRLEFIDAGDPPDGELAWLRDLRVASAPDSPEEDSESVRFIARMHAISQEVIFQEEKPWRPEVADITSLSCDGRYEILGVLGHGGMGIVYKVRDVKLNRLAAIKLLSPRKLADPAAVARFRREIRSVARLAHPNIVTAYDADEANGRQYLVMEYIDGIDLRSLVKTMGPLPFLEAVDYVLQAARSLGYAHRMRIVHRDVKPANMMRDASGAIKILDLGLSSCGMSGDDSCDLTESGVLLGTVDFLAPEQAANIHLADHRSDIYSLGCSLYYLLTGSPVFDGQTIVQKLLAHREQSPALLNSARSDVPDWGQAIFEKMVAKSPEDRYQNMDELIDDLEHQRRPMLPTGSRLEDLACARSAKRRRRGVFTASLVTVVAAVVAIAIPFALRSGSLPDSLDQQPSSAQAVEDAKAQSEEARELRPLPPISDSAIPGQWYDVLPIIPVGGAWKITRDGLFQSPIQPNTVITIPLEIQQSYQWRSEFTRNSGTESVNFYFPVGDYVGVLYFDIEGVDSLVIDQQFGPASPVKSARQPLVSGRRYGVTGRVQLREDQVTLSIELDGRQHLHWSGPLSRLQTTTTSGRFAIGSRDGDTIFHTFHVLLDGPVSQDD